MKRKANNQQDGFALPLVIVLGFILAVGGMTLLARSFGGMIGSIRQQKSREAREAAELGAAITMEALNGRYGHLMINCFPNSNEPTETTEPIEVMEPDPNQADFDTAQAAYNQYLADKNNYEQYLKDLDTWKTTSMSASKDAPVKNSCWATGGWGVNDTDLPADTPPETKSSLCLFSELGHPAIKKTLTSPNSRYRIDFFAFNGTEFYGGKGTLRVTGESLSTDGTKILSTATVQQTFNIIPELCGGYPGLLMIYDGELGGGDILGLQGSSSNNQASNVHCIQCEVDGDPDQYGAYSRTQLEAAVGANNTSEITGNITIGPIPLPEVPTFPFEQVQAYNTANSTNISITPLIIDDATRIDALATEETFSTLDVDTRETVIVTPATSPTSTEASCAALKDPYTQVLSTHCLIDTISLSNKKLTINSDASPIRLYLTGRTIDASGKGGIVHENNGKAGRLALFGWRPDDSKCTSDLATLSTTEAEGHSGVQQIKLSGGSDNSSLFGYFPCGVTGINGGSDPNDPHGNTVDGDGCADDVDMKGSIWTAYWGFSKSNNAELCVPTDMVDQLRQIFGEQFALSVRRYRAQGISDWRGFQGLSQ